MLRSIHHCKISSNVFTLQQNSALSGEYAVLILHLLGGELRSRTHLTLVNLPWLIKSLFCTAIWTAVSLSIQMLVTVAGQALLRKYLSRTSISIMLGNNILLFLSFPVVSQRRRCFFFSPREGGLHCPCYHFSSTLDHCNYGWDRFIQRSQ